MRTRARTRAHTDYWGTIGADRSTQVCWKGRQMAALHLATVRDARDGGI